MVERSYPSLDWQSEKTLPSTSSVYSLIFQIIHLSVKMWTEVDKCILNLIIIKSNNSKLRILITEEPLLSEST